MDLWCLFEMGGHSWRFSLNSSGRWGIFLLRLKQKRRCTLSAVVAILCDKEDDNV
jgi:hypothetical protein